ncbi:MAG: Abi family protein [Bacteroides sp.]|nr:Abi family protein [Bacteroides sp.]
MGGIFLKDFCENENYAYFCIDKSRPLPIRTAYPAGPFFYVGMIYTKQAISINEQIDVLRQRGLIIEDETKAHDLLERISYFRLADYWRMMEADRGTHEFKPGSRFSTVADYYAFDKQLKVLLFSAIQVIEIAMRSKVIKYFAPVAGPMMPERQPGKWITDFSFPKTSLYPQLCCIAYWINSIQPGNSFAIDIKSLICNHPEINPAFMGFPASWCNEPLWK